MGKNEEVGFMNAVIFEVIPDIIQKKLPRLFCQKVTKPKSYMRACPSAGNFIDKKNHDSGKVDYTGCTLSNLLVVALRRRLFVAGPDIVMRRWPEVVAAHPQFRGFLNISPPFSKI